MNLTSFTLSWVAKVWEKIKEDIYSHILFLRYTNLIPFHTCNLWWKPLTDHSFKHILETQQCKQLFKLNTPNFRRQKVCKHHYSHSFLPENNWMKMFIGSSLRDGGGPRWAVRVKGLGLYTAKRGCVSKHPPLLLLGQTWFLIIADSCRRWKDVHRLQARTSTKPQSNAKDKARPEVVQPEV